MSNHKRLVRRSPVTVVQSAARWIGSFDPFGPYSPELARR